MLHTLDRMARAVYSSENRVHSLEKRHCESHHKGRVAIADTIVRCCLIGWMTAACLGILFQILQTQPLRYDEGDTARMVVKHEHQPKHIGDTFLVSFDRIFKMMGGIMVGLAWSVRVAIKSLAYVFSPARTSMTSSEHIWFPAALYAWQGILRAWIYNMHTAWMQANETIDHMMSDHVLLSSCIIAGLVSEIYLLLTSEIHVSSVLGGRLMRSMRDTPLMVVVTCIHVLVGILGSIIILLIFHVYRTARYHHTPMETVASVALGSVLFKLTSVLSVWCRLRRSFRTTRSGKVVRQQDCDS